MVDGVMQGGVSTVQQQLLDSSRAAAVPPAHTWSEDTFEFNRDDGRAKKSAIIGRTIRDDT
jgi:hypothetical protein